MPCWVRGVAEAGHPSAGADNNGVDGRIYFPMYGEKNFQSMILEVKSGKHVGLGVLRVLRGVLEDNRARMAGLIVLNPAGERQTATFGRFMAEAGSFEVLGRNYPRMQMLTVAEILDGKRFNTLSRAARGLSQREIF